MTAARTVTVGTATAAPGTIARGAIPVTTLAGGTPLEIPVVVVNGASRRTVLLGRWRHPRRRAGRAARLPARACARSIRQQLSGTLVMVPVLNVPAFEAAQRGNPLDTFSYDMNRIYPGRANGYLTERLAAAHAAALEAQSPISRSRSTRAARTPSSPRRSSWTRRPESVELATAMGPGWGCIMSSTSCPRAARWPT